MRECLCEWFRSFACAPSLFARLVPRELELVFVYDSCIQAPTVPCINQNRFPHGSNGPGENVV